MMKLSQAKQAEIYKVIGDRIVDEGTAAGYAALGPLATLHIVGGETHWWMPAGRAEPRPAGLLPSGLATSDLARLHEEQLADQATEGRRPKLPHGQKRAHAATVTDDDRALDELTEGAEPIRSKRARTTGDEIRHTGRRIRRELWASGVDGQAVVPGCANHIGAGRQLVGTWQTAEVEGVWRQKLVSPERPRATESRNILLDPMTDVLGKVIPGRFVGLTAPKCGGSSPPTIKFRGFTAPKDDLEAGGGGWARRIRAQDGPTRTDAVAWRRIAILAGWVSPEEERLEARIVALMAYLIRHRMITPDLEPVPGGDVIADLPLAPKHSAERRRQQAMARLVSQHLDLGEWAMHRPGEAAVILWWRYAEKLRRLRGLPAPVRQRPRQSDAVREAVERFIAERQ